MPVWYEKTRPLLESGELQIVGIVQEQHPDRTALYKQWREFDFPILWDPFGYTGLEVVPVITGIDEHGVVRLPRPNLRKFDEQFMAGFMEQEFEAPAADAAPAQRAFRVSEAARGSTPSPHRAAARLLLGRASAPTIDAEVASLELHAAASGKRPVDEFRAGVARRMRYDGPSARSDDFQVAVDAWRAALLAKPNQYIWRRRIQQWGPRLDKPYAFYDWVEGARAAIAARGERPVDVLVPLSGSEVADQSRAVPTPTGGATPPDPTGKVTRDAGVLVRVETAVALNTAAAGPKIRTPRGASRVHVTLRPRGAAKWTSDADPAQLWIDLPEGWLANSPLVTFPVPLEGKETRPLSVDFEASTPLVALGPPDPDAPPPADAAVLRGHVVYSICLEDGTCVFRRQDVVIAVALPFPGGPGSSGDGDGDDDGDGHEPAPEDND